jgi:hypothetical protein
LGIIAITRFGKDILGPSVHPQNEKGLPVYNPSGKYAFRFFWYQRIARIPIIATHARCTRIRLAQEWCAA